jgi:hypothetical protein
MPIKRIKVGRGKILSKEEFWRQFLKRKEALERKRLRMSFEEKMKELEEIVEWLDPRHWEYPENDDEAGPSLSLVNQEETSMSNVQRNDGLDSYKQIKKQEMAELRKMSAGESLRRGLILIAEVAKWKK